ncbi:hypothetical protein E1B28_009828 [Marasmius oreades]|uniref:Iron-sulfur assembly protein 1 n=1 Tax=Marasmius oreades TaxID=181124 RepID=A0A9P7UQV6_9AGAR|nr:uncharacterized protein E1B28_009828 [Marasmius oreades]KAG7090738.1 hypothetical protein E1B28_009828 [Marasmius oreades]
MSTITLYRLHHATRSSSLPLLHSFSSITSTTNRRAMMSAFRPQDKQHEHEQQPTLAEPPVVIPSATTLSSDAASPQTVARPPPAPKAERPRPKIRAQKAALNMKPEAVMRLRALQRGPTQQLLRIGVRNKGCAGLSYHLEYVDKPGKFDEVVEQDGVQVIVDSKALFSIIGSEMDWKDDALSSRFVFKNPNIKDACGCGESFTV